MLVLAILGVIILRFFSFSFFSFFFVSTRAPYALVQLLLSCISISVVPRPSEVWQVTSDLRAKQEGLDEPVSGKILGITG